MIIPIYIKYCYRYKLPYPTFPIHQMFLDPARLLPFIFSKFEFNTLYVNAILFQVKSL